MEQSEVDTDKQYEQFHQEITDINSRQLVNSNNVPLQHQGARITDLYNQLSMEEQFGKEMKNALVDQMKSNILGDVQTASFLKNASFDKQTNFPMSDLDSRNVSAFNKPKSSQHQEKGEDYEVGNFISNFDIVNVLSFKCLIARVYKQRDRYYLLKRIPKEDIAL